MGRSPRHSNARAAATVLTRQVGDGKEGPEDGLLAIEVELIDGGEFLLDLRVQFGPARGIGAADKPRHRRPLAGDDFVSDEPAPRRAHRHARQELQQQFHAGTIGVHRVGSGEPVSRAVLALEKAGAAVVHVNGKPSGLLTRQDVLTFFAANT